MTNDLPDFQSEVVSAAVEATALRSGLDADKPASPAAGDIWLARDTFYLYVCFVAGSWEKVAKLYLPLAGGTMTGAIAMGTKKITGLAAPTAAADAARKTEVDTVDAKLDDVSHSEPSRAFDTVYQNDSKIRVVLIDELHYDDLSYVRHKIGATNPPTTVLADLGHGTGAESERKTITFIVPPDYYYAADILDGSPFLAEWHEWDLH